MKTIVLASSNKHKLKEYKEILKDYNIITLKDIDYSNEIEEDGKTFEENALIKAKTISKYLKEKNLDYIVIGEDSGLCVDSLNGEPGIYSARYSGVHGDNQANRDKLQKELQNKDRSAYFMCTIVVYYPNDDLNKTFGEASEEEKNKVSHRGRAIKEMLKGL